MYLVAVKLKIKFSDKICNSAHWIITGKVKTRRTGTPCWKIGARSVFSSNLNTSKITFSNVFRHGLSRGHFPCTHSCMKSAVSVKYGMFLEEEWILCDRNCPGWRWIKTTTSSQFGQLHQIMQMMRVPNSQSSNFCNQRYSSRYLTYLLGK